MAGGTFRNISGASNAMEFFRGVGLRVFADPQAGDRLNINMPNGPDRVATVIAVDATQLTLEVDDHIIYFRSGHDADLPNWPQAEAQTDWTAT